MVVPWADVNLVRLPNEMESHRAASLGCRFVTSFGGLVDQARVAPGETVVVYGCGGVGLSAVMIAAGAGARIIAVDIREEKLVRPRRGDPLDEKRAGVGVRRTDGSPFGRHPTKKAPSGRRVNRPGFAGDSFT